MRNPFITFLAAALATAGPALSAQDVKFNGALVELYWTQMMDHNLRLNSATHSPAYNSLVAGMTENQFLVKRAELYFGGKITDDVSWTMMFDPNNTGSTTFGAVLHDVTAIWKLNSNFTLRAGQFKFLQTYEASTVSARDILFYDRAQLSRVFGDRRDRGIMVSYSFGDPKAFNGLFHVAATNGMSDNGSGGKQNEVNAQKDFHARLDLINGKHKFGAYYRAGSTDVADKGAALAGTTAAWGSGAPNAAAILANKDKISNLGVYYFWDTPEWQVSGEAITGLLGRRFPTLFSAATAVGREHLDQKYLGYYVQGAYKKGHHWFTARYDFMDYNSGSDWYTAYNPYKESAPGVAKLVNGAPVDYTPKFTEFDLGYNYVFNPSKSSTGKLKVNYVWRSKNFLAPRAGQTGEQGGDSLVASLQIGF